MLDQKKLHEVYEYRDGDLYYKATKGRAKVGSKAGFIHSYKKWDYSYKRVMFEGKIYYLGRLIFHMFHGYLPEIVYPIDHNPLNTKIENLKAASYSQSLASAGKQKNNTSGYKGVSFNKNKEKWQARIMKNYEAKSLGYFDTPKEAHQAYCKGAKRLYGEFANFG